MKDTGKALAERIQRLRKDSGLTQGQLAQQLNVSFQTVSKWENGKSVPDALLLPELAEIFGCTIDELFCRARPSVYFKIPDEFLLLWRLTEKQLEDLKRQDGDLKNKQVIAMFSTGECPVFLFVNDILSGKEEEEMLAALAARPQRIDRILCTWVEGGVDLPSHRFRKGLLEIDPENRHAQILLMSDNGLRPRSLGSTMP